MSDPLVVLTAPAVARFKNNLAQVPSACAIRLTVKPSGCSGWMYQLDLAETEASDDTVVEQDGVRILIDPASIPLLKGTTVDFVSEGLNQNFKFNNPQAQAECGCGESFTVDYPAKN